MKKVLKVFFITVILMLAMALSVSANGSVTKLEKTAKATGGTGADITIITANKFLMDDCIMFQFKGNEAFLDGAECNIKIGNEQSRFGIYYENGVYYTQTSMWNFDISSAGKKTVNVELCSYYNDVKYSTSFDIQFVEELLDTSTCMGVREKVTISKYANGMNVEICSTNEFYPANVVIANKKGVKYMGMDPQNYNEPYDTYISNIYYADIFDAELLDRFSGIEGYSYTPWLEQGRPLEAGIYDIWVYDEEGKNYTVIKDAVEVVDMPAVEIYDTDHYIAEAKPGDKKFGLGVATQGIDINEFSIKLYDQNDNLFATSTGKEILINNYQENQYVVEMEAVDGFAYGRYDAEIVTDREVMLDSWVHFSDYGSAERPYISGYETTEALKANYVLFIKYANPTQQYKFELYDPSNVQLSETYAYVSEDGYVDLEFLDKNGNVIDITPRKNYKIAFYYKKDGVWKSAEKQSVSKYPSYTSSSSSSSGGAATSLSGSAYIDDGSVYGNLTMPQSMKSKYSSDSLFELRVLSITGDVYKYTPKCSRSTLSNGSYYIWMEKTDVNLPVGSYKVAIYYNSKVVVDYEDYFNFSQSYNVSTYWDGINSTRYIRRVYSELKTPTVKLYSILDGDFEPEYEATLVKEGDVYVIPDSAAFDKNHKYFYEITAGTSADPDFYTGSYFSTKTAPNSSKKCTVTVKQTENGTTSVSNTNPSVGEIVYVTAKADEGYMYESVSVKVNGTRIMGRSFTVFENATVEVEYKEIPQAMYMVSTDDHNSSYVSSSTDKTYYKAGETVKVNVKINGDRYKLGELYYIKAGDNYNNRVDIDKTTMSFVMPEADITITAGYDWKYEYYVSKETYDDYAICINGSQYDGSYVFEGEKVTVGAYLYSTNKELPVSEFETLYYIVNGDTTKQYPIINGNFIMPDGEVKIYGILNKKPLKVTEITGRGGDIKFYDKDNREITEAYATEEVTVKGTGVGSFKLRSLEVNGVTQTDYFTFEVPAGNLKLKVNFESYDFQKVTILPSENGSVSVELDEVYGDGVDYETGRELVFEIKPDRYYKLKSILINDYDYIDEVRTDNTVKYRMRTGPSEIIVKAVFEQTHYEVVYVDENNQLLTKQYYEIGTEGVYNSFTPYKAPDGTNAYIFNGWNKEFVTGADTVKVSFTTVPYTTISNEEELKNISGDGYYVLTEDITLTEKWTPIENFAGTFDGCGHIIKNLDSKLVVDGDNYWQHCAGFIVNLTGDVINTGFELAHNQETAADELYVGGIATKMIGARVENCYVSGTMKYNEMSGGPIAYSVLNNSVIRNCYTNVDAKITDASFGNFGGMFGWADETAGIFSSYSNTVCDASATNEYYINKIGNVDDYSTRVENVYYNIDRYTGYDNEHGPVPMSTEKLKTLSSFYNGLNHTFDFGKVWGLDSAINDGLPSLKIFGTNQVTATSNATMLGTDKIKASIKFSHPIAGEMFATVRSGQKTITKQIKVADVVDSLDLTIETINEPDEAKVFVWESLANVKPVIMETLEIE